MNKFFIVLAIAICAVASFVGYNTQKEEQKAAEAKQQQPKETKAAAAAPSEPEEDPQQEETPIPEGGPSQDENFTPEELEASKKVAIDFTKEFHNFDAAKPSQNIENSKKFMDEGFYSEFIKNVSRGTLDAVKKQWLEVGVTETSNTSKDKLIWNVVVQTENTDNDGNKNYGEDWYLVELKKEQDQYKVTGVTVNAAH
ncbi:hypothetical protein [Priestia megaterium]|uniref:hypothetical protein n=1 Tax=Priestia megaterium TaxID=1404 RepID=UPI002E1FE023|nr:hypothetical protein [Priestia megaterium]MED4102153.1 hypothetical protein [Priestia megaterium]MED4142580.1 hypothetical protein [Priestia megaterium]